MKIWEDLTITSWKKRQHSQEFITKRWLWLSFFSLKRKWKLAVGFIKADGHTKARLNSLEFRRFTSWRLHEKYVQTNKTYRISPSTSSQLKYLKLKLNIWSGTLFPRFTRHFLSKCFFSVTLFIKHTILHKTSPKTHDFTSSWLTLLLFCSYLIFMSFHQSSYSGRDVKSDVTC